MKQRLIQAAEVALGRQRAPQYEQGDNLISYLRSANIVDGDLNLDDIKRMNFDPVQQLVYALRDGDVLVTEGSGSKETVGTSAVWREDLPGVVCFQNTLLRVRPRNGRSDGRYLAWWLRHAHASGLIAKETRGANIQHIGAEALRGLEIDLPALGEQRRIADFLDINVTQIDEVIELRREQADAVRELLNSSVATVITRGGDESSAVAADWAPFGEVPSSWGQTRLRSLRCLVQTGPFGSQLHSEEYVDDGWPIVNPAGISNDGLVAVPGMSVDDATRFRLERHILQAGDVVFGRRGELGRAGIVTSDQVGWVCGTGSLLVRLNDPRLRPKYLMRLLRTAPLRYYFQSQSVGSTMDNLNTGILLAMPVLLPPVEEQDRLVGISDLRTEAAEFAISEMNAQVSLLQQRKRSLITAAVTGQFDVSTASGREVVAG